MNIDTLNDLLLSHPVWFAKLRSEKRQGLYNIITVQCTHVDLKIHLMYLLSSYIAPLPPDLRVDYSIAIFIFKPNDMWKNNLLYLYDL